VSRPADSEQLLGELDGYRDAPGTLRLFDAILAEDAEGVRRALARSPRHPLAERAGAWLSARGAEAPRPATPDEVLVEAGIVDLEAHLADAAAERARLQASIDRLQAEKTAVERSASAYAAVSVACAVAAVLGWMAAMGDLPGWTTPGMEASPTTDATGP
jgi:hypothetical protein